MDNEISVKQTEEITEPAENTPQAPEPKKDNRKALIIAVVASALAIVAALLTVYFILNRDTGASVQTEPYTTSAATGTEERTEAVTDKPGSVFPYGPIQSEKHGVCEGKNVVVIQIPGLIDRFIGLEYEKKEITPNLNALLGDSLYCKNAVAACENAAELQFVIDNSLYPPEYGNPISDVYGTDFRGLPSVLAEKGYKTFSFSYGQTDAAVTGQYAYSDALPYGEGKKTSFELAKEALGSCGGPFYAVISCGGSVYPYFTSDKTFGGKSADYQNALHEQDKLTGDLIKALKDKDLYDDTVIVVTGTPCEYDPENKNDAALLKDLFGKYTLKDRITVPVIIKFGESAVYDKLVSQVDLMPTLLDLLGFDGEDMFFVGENILTTARRKAYIRNTYPRGSFVSDERTVMADKTHTPRLSRSYNHITGGTGAATGSKDEINESVAYFEDFDLSLSFGIIKLAKEKGRYAAISGFEEAKANMKKTVSYSIADTFPSNESKDFYKSDVKLFNKAKMLTANEFDGCFDGVIFKNDGLMLTPGKKEGVFISSDIDLNGKFDTLIASWNANTAGGTVEISVAAKKDDGSYTGWYSWGVWSQTEGVSASRSFSDSDGKLDTDTLKLKKKCAGAVRVKAVLKQTGDASPVLYNFTLAVNKEKGQITKETKAYSYNVPIPKYYQYDVPVIGGSICSPTSLTMVLDGLGEKLKPADTAAGVYDNGENIYGNWSYNVAFAGELGYNAYLDFYDINALQNAVYNDTAVVCSIAVKKGQLAGSGYPDYSTAGHLLTITGFDRTDGELWLLSNDPAQNGVSVRYKASEFEKVWKGVVYIVQKHPERYTWRIGEGTDRDMLIVADHIPEGRYNRPGGNYKVKYIVIHNTGNFSSGADALAHRNYVIADGTQTSWHFTVDDTSIYKHLPEEERAWHAGDGREGRGNTYGIGIEICVNHEKNGETECSKYFRESLENAAVLCAELMHKYNLSIRAVTQHYDYSGKNCPQTIRECGLWDEFKQMIQNRYDELKQLRSGK